MSGLKSKESSSPQRMKTMETGTSENTRSEQLSWGQKVEAVLVAVSAFITCWIVFGFIVNLSIYYVEFKLAFPEDLGLVSLAVFLPVGTFGMVGLITGVVINTVGVRITAVAGALLMSVGIGASAFATNVPFLIAFFAICVGVGCSFLYLTITTGIATYFTNVGRQILVFLTLGNAIGYTTFPPLVSYFIDVYLWRGSLLIYCGVTMHSIPCALMYSIKAIKKSYRNKLDTKPGEGSNKSPSYDNFSFESISVTKLDSERLSHHLTAEAAAESSGEKTANPTGRLDTNDEVKERQCLGATNGNCKTDVNDASINCVHEVSTIQIIAPPTNHYKPLKTRLDLQKTYLKKDPKDIRCYEKHESECLEEEKEDTKLSIKAVFKSILSNKNYDIFLFNSLIMFGCLQTTFTILPDYCVQLGMTLSESAQIFAIGAIGNIISRAMGCWILHKYTVSTLIICSISTISSALLIAVYPFLTTPVPITLLTFCIMMTSGMFYSMYPIVILDFFDTKRYAIAMSLCQTFMGTGVVVNGYMFGLFTASNQNNYTYTFYLLALLGVVSILPTLAFYIFNQSKNKLLSINNP